MEFHPLANVLPMIEGDAFDELVADIKTHGLREPVMVYEGKILDGRNRFRACLEIGVQPALDFLNGQDPVAYVLSMNVHRRHLSTGQRAMIAAQLANMPKGYRSDKPSAKLREVVSQPEAAKMLNVSERSVQTAAFIKQHGTEADVADIVNDRAKPQRVVRRIKGRTPEARSKDAERSRAKRAPAKRVRKEKALIQTVVIATQQIAHAAEALTAIEALPDLGERTTDVIKDLKRSYTAIGRVVRSITRGTGE